MNDPSKAIIDIEEQRRWLKDHRVATGASWNDLSKRVGVPSGTLSQFGGANGYAGDESRPAEGVYRYRQTLMAQAEIEIEAPEVPDYYETETSRQIGNLLRMAQRGRIVVAAMGAGLGKTKTARRHAACFSNVFVATMSPSTAGVNTMQIEVLEALGERDAAGTPQKLSRRIRERVKDAKSALIVIDEAQHLTEKAIEEIRSWNDAVGVGIALLGNESVMQRLEGGNRRAAFAQMFSRVALRLVRSQPLRADIDAMIGAWQIDGAPETAFLHKIAMTPGALRGATMALELGSMIAASEQKPLALDHLQDAWAQLSSRPVLA